jgi:hypothetical protein
MTPLLIAELIAKVGLPLAQQLIALYHSGNAPITSDQWAALAALGQYRSSDALAAAGVKPTTT